MKTPYIKRFTESRIIDSMIRNREFMHCSMQSDCDGHAAREMDVHFVKYECMIRDNEIFFMYGFVDNESGQVWKFYKKDIHWNQDGGFYLNRYNEGVERLATFTKI